MISNREKCEDRSEGKQQWDYLAVKKISALLRGLPSKNNEDFCCLNCLHCYRTTNINLNRIKKHAIIKTFVM